MDHGMLLSGDTEGFSVGFVMKDPALGREGLTRLHTTTSPIFSVAIEP